MCSPRCEFRENRAIIKAIRQAIKDRKTANFIVSFPKTGRTWLRVMVGRMLVDAYGVPEDLMLSTYKATRAARLPRTVFSHGGAFHLLDDCPHRQLDFDWRLFHARSVVFLTRDIRDTLVSFYFQQERRERVFSGDIKKFIRDERFGAPKIVRFYTLWFQASRSMPRFHWVGYEQMRDNPVDALAGVATFLGFERADRAVIERAVEFGSFDNMKSMERQGQFDRKMMKPGDPGDAESFKVRKGKVGGFVEYLDNDDQAYINGVVNDLGDADCDWYWAPQPESATPSS